MTQTYPLKSFTDAPPQEIEEALERAEVVYFDRCPIALPSEEDLEFLRTGLPRTLKSKNISYHPESDSVPKFEATPEIEARVQRVLKAQGQRVAEYLQRVLPDFVPGWSLGTTSFRPIEERGRDLEARSSNELVHIDAGAYGATNGARIFRFFVNVNPAQPRVWGTKGSFRSLMASRAELWEAARDGKPSVPLTRTTLDNAYSGLVGALGKLYPLARVIDSSPYDRTMRRIHNCMKEDPRFRDDPTDYREIHFPPMSAWMVFTDGVSHSVLRGQHAFVTTALVPLANCRLPELSPYRILASETNAA